MPLLVGLLHADLLVGRLFAALLVGRLNIGGGPNTCPLDTGLCQVTGDSLPGFCELTLIAEGLGRAAAVSAACAA